MLPDRPFEIDSITQTLLAIPDALRWQEVCKYWAEILVAPFGSGTGPKTATPVPARGTEVFPSLPKPRSVIWRWVSA